MAIRGNEKSKSIVPSFPVDVIEGRIIELRGVRVILDADLARLYGATTKRLNEQVKRNADRFPADFMFQLTDGEKNEVVANCDHLQNLKFSPNLPHAFTEHGALMAANLLNSEEAVKVSAFVKLREMLSTHKELASKLSELESRLENHDGQISALIGAIRQFMAEPKTSRRPPIGYHTELTRKRGKPSG